MAAIEKRVSKNGQESYRVKIRLKGHPPVTASFERITDAKRWAQKVETEIREGRYFQKQEAQKHTVAEAIERYLEQVTLENPKRVREATIYLTWWKKNIGTYLLSNLSKAVIVESREALQKEDVQRGKKFIKRKNATINRYICVLRVVLNRAVSEWEWLQHNPIRDLSDLKEPKGRNRYLTDDERKALLAACKNSENKYLYSIVVLAISSGARKNEINCIKWEDVNLSHKIIVLTKTKNKETRVIHLHGEALAEIQRLHSEKSKNQKYVFPASENPDQPIYFRRAWNTAVRRAKIGDFRFHDLRHTAASYLAMNGANMKDIAEILGHKSLAMTNRYAHLSVTHTSKVVERMNGKIFQIQAA